MSKKRTNTKHRRRSSASRRSAPRPPAETREAEVITVAWTVSLTTVFLCNLLAMGAHWYVAQFPEAANLKLLENLMLFGGCVVGIVSLVLLPFVYRVRRLPPPPGFVVFGVLIAVAPILAVLTRLLRQ